MPDQLKLTVAKYELFNLIICTLKSTTHQTQEFPQKFDSAHRLNKNYFHSSALHIDRLTLKILRNPEPQTTSVYIFFLRMKIPLFFIPEFIYV